MAVVEFLETPAGARQKLLLKSPATLEPLYEIE
jgi:hypothetical protein